MTDIIGRKKEIEKLQTLLKSSKSELLVIYGRRRIGKTYLINQFFQDKGVYFELTGVFGGKTSEQLRQFPLAFQEAFKSKEYFSPPKDWTELFDRLFEATKKIPSHRKIILFFDELPWLATQRSNLLRALEHAWNRYFSRQKNLILVLCGSATSWMVKKIVNNRGGLYGRLTEHIHLQPFSLLETEYYLQSNNIQLDRKQIVEVYMATGGVAKYLNQIKRGASSAQIIQSLCFSSDGFLSFEFRRLFESLFDNYKRHMQIIEILAKRKKGCTVNELLKFTNMSSGGRLSETLKELEDCGFIQSIPFFGKKKRESRFRVIDEYSLFYLSWIEPALFNQNKPISNQYWINLHRSPRFLNWCGYAFESICFKHIDRIVESLKISVVAKNCSYWEHYSNKKNEIPGAQIDLIIDRSDQCINLCEVKFSDSEYILKKEYATKINERKRIFQMLTNTKKTIFNTLITPFGVKENPAYFSSIDQNIDLNSLFLW